MSEEPERAKKMMLEDYSAIENDITTLFAAVEKLSKLIDVQKLRIDAADKTLDALEKTDDDLCTDLTELSGAVTHLRTDIGETQSWCEAQDESIKRLAERCADADDEIRAREHITVNGEPAMPPHTDSAGLKREFRAWEAASEEDAEKVPLTAPAMQACAEDVEELQQRIDYLERMQGVQEGINGGHAHLLDKAGESIDKLEQRFSSLDDCVCETDDAVAEMKKRMEDTNDANVREFQAVHKRIDSLELRLDDAQNQAQAQADNEAEERPRGWLTDEENAELARLRAGEPWNVLTDVGKKRLAELEAKLNEAKPQTQEPPAGTQWHATPQYATAQDVAALKDALAGWIERVVRKDIARLGVDLRTQLTAMHADLGKALAAAQVGGGDKLLAVESTVRNGIERVIRMLHDVMARTPAQKEGA